MSEVSDNPRANAHLISASSWVAIQLDIHYITIISFSQQLAVPVFQTLNFRSERDGAWHQHRVWL
ncbi:uncharacterized protein SPAPADRAFT_59423 [Spathaspora passalidarum NRRL Y-27907]|uniref:Uncharacterized protein n=1 Tax=Spathaspora passalidarum (strain NRRL Y-27907 / 11-Y1) TaxID=619300 RepID=G3AJW0_SPAPN|nr:uncharacterized protein SPAPADRAFT_59423 [Spathaspora passalidarum NRRL Y-27907]EGW34011.1 hypothetical protein SPAPADRAFT_59423 [Spathaspora passalidarum NRRL Y-27907]